MLERRKSPQIVNRARWVPCRCGTNKPWEILGWWLGFKAADHFIQRGRHLAHVVGTGLYHIGDPDNFSGGLVYFRNILRDLLGRYGTFADKTDG